jgi:hypothetical protein
MRTLIGTALTIVTVVDAALNGHDAAMPRTEWGDADLEGTWLSVNTVGVPFQRPADDGDASLLRELVDAGAVDPGLINEGVPPAPRLEERRWALTDWRRTHFAWASLVVDPPDGRIRR